MVNYAESKIYKIVGSGLTYYGSSCAPTLAKRLAQHVDDYKRYKNGKYGYTTSFNIIELGDYTIVLVEKFPCESKDELHARERFYIENNDCVNKRIPNRTKVQYYKDNIIRITANQKIYDEKNKIATKLKRRKKHSCICGGKYTLCHMAGHAKTKKHQAYVAINISDSA
jgi:hypothetical protein